MTYTEGICDISDATARTGVFVWMLRMAEVNGSKVIFAEDEEQEAA